MTNKEAIEMLKSKMDGSIDTSYSWCEAIRLAIQALEKTEKTYPWEHIWDAPDGTFKGRCDNCGFVHYFIDGHDTQYKFCPQCGEQKNEL